VGFANLKGGFDTVQDMTSKEFNDRASKLFTAYFEVLGIRKEANREAGDML